MDRNVFDNQVERILRSSALASKPQLQRLLGILATHFDTQSTLKPDRVMRELWPDEPSRLSSHLATAINRLRKALELYYAEAGVLDEVLIRLPKRGGEEAADHRAHLWITAETREIPGMLQAAAAEVQKAEPQLEASNGKAAGLNRAGVWLAAGAMFACCVILGAVLTRGVRGRPATARIDGNMLVVVNAKGQELWSRSFPDGFWQEFYKDGLATKMWFGDLDGSGRTSALLVYHPAVDAASRSSSLICFSQSGEEKWRWEPERVLPELGSEPAVYRTVGLAVLKARPGAAARIVVMSRHHPQYPTQIALLDAKGNLLSEYWHSGHLDQLMLADLDGDGEQEILGFGESKGYNQATLVVLDPNHFGGASAETARPQFQIHGVGTAHERFRLLFPGNDLTPAGSVTNQAREMTFANGVLRVSVEECSTNEHCVHWYDFDGNLNLRNVYSDDSLGRGQEEIVRGRSGQLSNTPNEEAFWKVRCLVGCTGDYAPVSGQRPFNDEVSKLKSDRIPLILSQQRDRGPSRTRTTPAGAGN